MRSTKYLIAGSAIALGMAMAATPASAQEVCMTTTDGGVTFGPSGDATGGNQNLACGAYSTASAQMKHARAERATLLGAVLHGAWTFFRTYVLRLGFLDGREGFLLAVLNAEVSYYRYVKLLLLSQPRKHR